MAKKAFNFKEKFRKYFILSGALSLILLGIFMAYYIYNETSFVLESTKWPKARGIIVGNSMEINHHRGFTKYYSPQITYSYAVDNKEYTNNKLSFPSYEGAEFKAQEKLDEYPLNKEIDVFYDPQNPKNSCLEIKGADYFFIIMIGSISIILILAGTSIFIFKNEFFKQ